MLSEVITEPIESVIENPPLPSVKIAVLNPNLAVAKVSAMSLSSIRAKKELAESQKSIVKTEVHLPSEAFTETEMLEQWFKYAQRLSDKGHLIMESLLNINDPKLAVDVLIEEANARWMKEEQVIDDTTVIVCFLDVKKR